MTRFATKEEEDEIIAETRHKELSGVLKGIMTTLNHQKNDNGVAQAIEKNGQVIQKVIDKLAEIGKVELPDYPEVNVNTNQDKVVSSVEQLGRDLLVELKKFNERPIIDKYEWKFTRGQWTQVIESATAKGIYKTISK